MTGFRWFASGLDAERLVRQRCSEIRRNKQMTDRELLEMAAKAAGIEGEGMQDEDGGRPYLHNWENGCVFDPLTDDGDALRLAVKLNLFNTRSKGYEWPIVGLFESHDDDPYAATRRAIVRAAAEIGKAMP